MSSCWICCFYFFWLFSTLAPLMLYASLCFSLI
uniref:Uncharacterized protein n=1 Tax=Arundo donax TaxID=35708 RepID=A0A0A9A399_ARUDO